MNATQAQNLTPLELERLAFKVAAEYRQEEPALIQSRWWDYRPLHPTVTTYLYADAYLAAHRAWWRRFIDCDKADDVQLWTDVFDSRDLTAMWLARQAADRIGCPYDVVMEFATDRAFGRQFKHMLRPNQLYDEEFEIDLLAAWEARKARQLMTAKHPIYLVSNYAGTKLQNAYRAYLVEVVNARLPPRHGLLARLLNEDAVSTAMVEHHWGPEELQRVLAEVKLLN